MKKKWLCMILAVLLVLSIASVALAAAPSGSPISTVMPLPSGEQLYVTDEYDESYGEYQMFNDYLINMDNNSPYERIYTVLDLNVYDEHLDALVPNSDFVGTDYMFGLPFSPRAGYTYSALHECADGSIEVFSDAGQITTTEGFGLFAIVEMSTTPYMDEIPCTGLPSGEKLFTSGQYLEGSPQWQAFADYMKQNGITGTLERVVEYSVWDTHLNNWISNSQFGDVSATITGEGGYTVFHNSSLSGGIENLGSSASFTTKTGFGLFAFVKPAAEPTPTPTASTDSTSPKTTDNNTNGPIGWILLAAVLTTALVVVVRKTRKEEK
ncbi:MAG: hypothetical protein VB082_03120 [Christensenella sp.]|nr:hypothetical protein [Christensenella sp.]